MRSPCPQSIGDSRVVCYSPIDARHQVTSNTMHIVGGTVLGSAAGIVISGDEGSYYLFGCDENWDVLSDTWHETLEEAKRQAEFEYAGISKTWVTLSPRTQT